MDAFGIRNDLIDGYRSFTEGFVDIQDDRIRKTVSELADQGRQWPDPWLSLNPSFQSGGSIDELVDRGILHEQCREIFRPKKDMEDRGSGSFTLHKHQADAVSIAAGGHSYVLTTGTGSGKSLSYIVPIVDRVLREGSGKGIKAIIVYPMNALANSQMEELTKFLEYGFGGESPVTFKRYTGQEKGEERESILKNPPDVILTNYVMLEYVLTRPEERQSLIRAASGLNFLVLDELHTYRGRQGADVALLVRRLRDACHAQETLQCVGTSATMSSGGTMAEQQQDIAEVATRIFGTEMKPDHVVTESLVRATTVRDQTTEDLKAAVSERGDAEFSSATISGGYVSLRSDPLASWIEDTFGLTTEAESSRLIRSAPKTVTGAAEVLAAKTDQDPKACATAIRATLLAGSKAKSQTGRPLFAFRLHQFISKGGSVYTTLEPEAVRLIETDFQLTTGEQEKRLYPLAFCRECGQEYLMARLVETAEGSRFIARHELKLQDDGGEDRGVDGYLFISTEQEWPDQAVESGRLPASWLNDAGAGQQVVESKRKRLPQRYRLGLSGEAALDNASTSSDGQLAAWIPRSLGFCLNCQVTYESARSGEFSKLVTLDQEGRSSAMTVIATRLVQLLKSDIGQDLAPEAKKLLTFVDNRQDASLQAGHLNDFVQVAQLRAAVYQAVAAAGEEGLEAADLGTAIVNTLNLEWGDYAQIEDPLDARPTRRALHDVVTYRALRDLQRGWRITLPNLEQTGLLKVQYPNARRLAEQDARWESAHYVLRVMDAGKREEIITVLLDEFRRVLAIDAEELTVDWLNKVKNRSREYLSGIWALPEREPDPNVGLVSTEPKKSASFRNILPVTAHGTFGRWLARTASSAGKLSMAETNEVIASLFEILHKTGLIAEVVEGKLSGYRLKLSTMVLEKGAGEYGAPDLLRRSYHADQKPRVIKFFKDLYLETGSQLAGLKAAEHTAQVRSEDREKREQSFRRAELPLLFCSPTMELGVDIASLNAVAMRNVPPTPANYAQRSGRAGRSGQPALVITYCATGSAHDSYYFERSDLMVAGQVQPPRLDFANEDLIRSHVHAVWLAEALSATSHGLGKSLAGLLKLEDKTYPIQPQIRSFLEDPSAAARAKGSAISLLSAIQHELADTIWWSADWADHVIDNAFNALNEACDRWRLLYRNALAEQDAAHKASQDHSVTSKQREEANNRHREASQRLEILLNDSDSRGQSDFYTLRYLASEGFLPGYSFPRLPLAAFIPGIRKGRDNNSTWLQRSRFLAISEFGPDALIYHEGARYQVKRVSLPRDSDGGGAGDVVLTEARVCEACGYLHERKPGIDVCESCNKPLGGSWSNLMQLQSVITRRRERISADEEERNRQGFELVTTYRFAPHGKKPGRVDAGIYDDGDLLGEVRYGDGATVRVTNLGRRNRKDQDKHGFWLDLITGEWLSEKRATEESGDGGDVDDTTVEQSKKKQMITPFVEDRRNIAIVRWAEKVTDEAATTMQYAIERGIEAVFQLEDSELASERLNDADDRGRLLFVEAAEGGAGVLRRLQSEPDAMAKVAAKALEIIHVNAATGEDDESSCVRGCYRCLLSYGNQRSHEAIDRRLVIDLLQQIARATTKPMSEPKTTQPDPVVSGKEPVSPRAEDFLRRLTGGGYNLPDDIGRNIAGNVVDFTFTSKVSLPTAVIVEDESRPPIDALALTFSSWNVITATCADDLDDFISRHPNVFGVST